MGFLTTLTLERKMAYFLGKEIRKLTNIFFFLSNLLINASDFSTEELNRQMKEKQQTSCQIFIAHHMRQNSAASYQKRREPGRFGKAPSNAAIETEKWLRKDRPGLTYCGWIALAEQWREVIN